MKGIIIKTIGAICFFAALSDATFFADAAMNGKDSRLAADLDEIKETVNKKRAARKAAKKADEPEVT
jgi:sialic acid synthase SpsE